VLQKLGIDVMIGGEGCRRMITCMPYFSIFSIFRAVSCVDGEPAGQLTNSLLFSSNQAGSRRGISCTIDALINNNRVDTLDTPGRCRVDCGGMEWYTE
jgi:hypothetical protein